MAKVILLCGKIASGKSVYAEKLARELGGEYLRLFVVDINHPAISFYESCGFSRADGVYNEVIDDHTILREYGYEKPLK